VASVDPSERHWIIALSKRPGRRLRFRGRRADREDASAVGDGSAKAASWLSGRVIDISLAFSASARDSINHPAGRPMSEAQTIEPKVQHPAPRAGTRRVDPKPLPPYNVILLDDDDHSYEYVIEMLGKIFAHTPETGYQMAKKVDSTGRVIVYTTHKEKAELKQDQIHAYGKDVRMERSAGSMSAVIEPAE
jgi:ATP-dependent Clp protease adaptor protein ClpS